MLQVSSCVESLPLLAIVFLFSFTEAESNSKEKPVWGCEIGEEASEIRQAILGQVSIGRDIDLLHVTYVNRSKSRHVLK